jgi:DNA modification methylase
MKPYYEHEGITIYHGDCRDVLPHLKADLVVTDPPYGINDAPIQGQGRTGKRVGGVNVWHAPSEWDGFIDPMWPALAAGSAPLVAWFGHWRKREEVASSVPYSLRCELIWSKDCHVGPPCPAAMRDERIWIFSRDAVTPTRFETTVWDEPIIPTWAHREHKNEKPLALMKRLVSWLAGDLVLDPFMGSGTTLRAAKDLGRKAIGIEIEERYCEIAAKRLSQEVISFRSINEEASAQL